MEATGNPMATLSIHRASRRLACFLLCGLAGLPAAAAPATPPPDGLAAGVWIEATEPWSPGWRSGLRPGGRLTAWRRSSALPAAPLPAGGRLDSPFDLERVLREEAPRGAVELAGVQGGLPFSATFAGGTSLEASGLRFRPGLPAGVLARLEEARRRARSGRREAGAALLAEASRSAWLRSDPERALWLERERARMLEGARSFRAADAAFDGLAQAFARWGRKREEAELLAEWAESLDRRWSWDRAVAVLDRAERALGADGDAVMTRAHAGFVRGEVLRHRDDYPGARRAHEAALALRLGAAPGSLDHAASLYVMGRVAAESGKGDADLPLRQSEWILRRLDPGSLQHGFVLDFQGHSRSLPDPDEAEMAFRQALEIARRREPGGFLEGRVLFHLGSQFQQRGDMLTAQWFLHEARQVVERLPESFLTRYLFASILVQQGYLSNDQGDEDDAYRLAREALALQRTINFRSYGSALALASLGQTAYRLDRFDEARTHLTEAVDILSELVPDSPLIGYHLLMLARTEAMSGRPEAAEAFVERARPIFEGRFARTRSYVGWLSARALVKAKSGRLEEAIELARAALERVEEFGKEEFGTIEMLGALADWERLAGRREDVREHACRAARLLAKLGDRFGPDETVRLRLARGYSRLFALCAEAEQGLGNLDGAFLAAEAGRARSLLELLAVRSLDEKEVPAEAKRDLKALLREREELSRALESAVGEADGARVSGLRAALEKVQGTADEIVEKIRRQAGRFAELRFPRLTSVAAVQDALDPGTLLLEYSIGDFESLLFVVPARGAPKPAFQALRLPFGWPEIEAKVRAFRELLTSPLSSPERLSERSRELHAMLVAPAGPWIEGADRLLIAADGPLHSLPFSALEGADGTPLIARRPLHSTASAALYVEVRKRRLPVLPPDRLRISAFGDPDQGGREGERPSDAAELKRSALRLRGYPLGPLPASRAEVEAIQSLFPRTRSFLGAAATEGRARSLDREVDIVHFAVHALVDASQPYRSSLVLAVPAGKGGDMEDGLFEAREIISSLSLNASLVTLSACETAMGRQMGGEGLVGLTRAFQFAGTRSVLASLWAVGDRPTAELMRRFYGGIRQGKSKDEALRAAQLELLGDPATSHPSSWAGFVLMGDYL